MEIKDTDKYLMNGGTYKSLVNDEVGFTARIMGGWFKKERLEIADRRDLTEELLKKGEVEVILDYQRIGYIDPQTAYLDKYEHFFRGDALAYQEMLTKKQHLRLRAEPQNIYDNKAIGIFDGNDNFLGYFKREIAQYITDTENFFVYVHEPVDREARGNKNEIGTLIIVINKSNYEKTK